MTINYKNKLGYPRRAKINFNRNEGVYRVIIWDMSTGELVAWQNMTKQEAIDYFAYYSIQIFKKGDLS